jgi:hypothetical protein
MAEAADLLDEATRNVTERIVNFVAVRRGNA